MTYPQVVATLRQAAAWGA